MELLPLCIYSLALIAPLLIVAMGDLKHLVVAKFKEGLVVEEIIQEMEKLLKEIDAVKSFEWGQDTGSEEMLRQGFTHVFLLTFRSSEDFTAFLGHPRHVEFSATFSAAIEKILLLDFPAVVVKAPTA
ncbi:stress-response A/B barrel domain-containing protein At5g22580 [Macadamia integrifolia]|uniref:stress-response A/B barrel domain-containing protein At5g22580 n=1 Tax=Macadamia integrifolia TaxID=60698 RepID=UPI001C4F349D|nr:stress-response A/B barrel domain-containing protein At5g22580 [Macadamia integrifolia]